MSSKPTIAGILLIIVFFLGIITSFLLIMFSTYFLEQSPLQTGESIIKGIVVYKENRTGVSGVLITLKPEGKNTTSGENGTYEFKNVGFGEHKLIINKSGYKTIKREIIIFQQNKYENIDLELEDGEGVKNIKDTNPEIGMTLNLIRICGALILVFSFLAFAGAMNAIRRAKYRLALIGAFFGIFTIGVGLGLIISIIALLLLLLSKSEFQ